MTVAETRRAPLGSGESKAARPIVGSRVRPEVKKRRAVILFYGRPRDVPAQAHIHAQLACGAPGVPEMQIPGVRASIPCFDGIELTRSIVYQAEDETCYRVPAGLSDQAGAEP